jgi:hypothetical protein
MLSLERDQHLLTSPTKGFVVSTSAPPQPSETSLIFLVVKLDKVGKRGRVELKDRGLK